MTVPILIFVIFYYALLCTLVLTQSPRKAINFVLVLGMTFALAWTLSIFGLQTSLGESLLYARVVFALGFLSMVGLFWFAHLLDSGSNSALGEKTTIMNSAVKIIVISFVVSLVAVTVYSSSIIADIVYTANQIPVPVYGNLFWLYVLALAGIGLWLVIIIINNLINFRGKTRKQMLVVGLTIVLSIATATFSNLIIPIITGRSDSSIFLPIAVMILMTGLSYAIIRHGLLDVKQTVVRGVAYVATLIALGVVYYALAYFVSSLLFKNQTTDAIGFSPVNVILALFLALLFQPIKNFFDMVSGKIFYRNDYDPQDALDEIGRIVASRIRVRPLLADSLQVIAETLRPTFAKFVLVDAKGEPIHRQGFGDLKTDSDLLGELSKVDIPLIVSSSLTDVNSGLRQAMSRKDVAAVAQIDILGRVNGYLLLGDKKSGTSYTRKDLDFISVMVDELAVAIENAERYEEIQELNRTLKERVDGATKELQGSNRKLQELDKTKDEFISMASHQLRTPLTTIKGYLSMILDGDAGEVSPSQRRFLEEAFNSSQRMVYLVSDFLNVSRIQTGKFQIDLKPCNLAEILNDEIGQLKIVAKSRQLKFIYDKSINFPTIDTDEDKIRQVMMNFVDNAIYYSMPKGEIRVVLSYNSNYVEFKVIDQGIGVPRDEQHKLFTKFSRASNAKKQRPDGTGIGLFMAKKVIVSLGGSLIFQSVEGKGSTFGFRLNRK